MPHSKVAQQKLSPRTLDELAWLQRRQWLQSFRWRVQPSSLSRRVACAVVAIQRAASQSLPSLSQSQLLSRLLVVVVVEESQLRKWQNVDIYFLYFELLTRNAQSGHKKLEMFLFVCKKTFSRVFFLLSFRCFLWLKMRNRNLNLE